MVTTFWKFIQLLIIRTILGPAPWSLGGGVQAPAVALAYLEHVSLAQGGERAKTKVKTGIQLISLLGGERLTPVQTLRRFHNTKAYFPFHRFSCSSQTTPLNSNLFSSLSCGLILFIRLQGEEFVEPPAGPRQLAPSTLCASAARSGGRVL